MRILNSHLLHQIYLYIDRFIYWLKHQSLLDRYPDRLVNRSSKEKDFLVEKLQQIAEREDLEKKWVQLKLFLVDVWSLHPKQKIFLLNLYGSSII